MDVGIGSPWVQSMGVARGGVQGVLQVTLIITETPLCLPPNNANHFVDPTRIIGGMWRLSHHGRTFSLCPCLTVHVTGVLPPTKHSIAHWVWRWPWSRLTWLNSWQCGESRLTLCPLVLCWFSASWTSWLLGAPPPAFLCWHPYLSEKSCQGACLPPSWPTPCVHMRAMRNLSFWHGDLSSYYNRHLMSGLILAVWPWELATFWKPLHWPFKMTKNIHQGIWC